MKIMKEKSVVRGWIETIQQNRERKIKTENTIKKMRKLFNELDRYSKNKLKYSLEYLLSNEEGSIDVSRKDKKMQNKMSAIIHILLGLPEKKYHNQCVLLKNTIDAQEELIQNFESQNGGEKERLNISRHDIRAEK